MVERLLAAGADVHAQSDVALRRASTNGHLRVVQCLLGAGARPAAIDWATLEPPLLISILQMVPRSRFAELPGTVHVPWVRFNLRLRRRLQPLLARARARLDHPPRTTLGVAAPTREQLIEHLRTAGRRFAREYWSEGLPIFFPGKDFGPVPDF